MCKRGPFCALFCITAQFRPSETMSRLPLNRANTKPSIPKAPLSLCTIYHTDGTCMAVYTHASQGITWHKATYGAVFMIIFTILQIFPSVYDQNKIMKSTADCLFIYLFRSCNLGFFFCHKMTTKNCEQPNFINSKGRERLCSFLLK